MNIPPAPDVTMTIKLSMDAALKIWAFMSENKIEHNTSHINGGDWGTWLEQYHMTTEEKAKYSLEAVSHSQESAPTEISVP